MIIDGDMQKEDDEKYELLLGCQIQANLKWHRQVDLLKSRLRTRLAGLTKLKFIVPFPTRKTITEGLFNSVLLYCLPLFGGLDVGDLNDLQVMQNQAARIVTLSPPRSERSIVFDKLKWLTVNQLIFYHSVISVFKIRSCKEPEYLADILNKDSRNGRIVIPNLDLRVTQRSFTMRASENWNLIPDIIRKVLKIGVFKKLVRKWTSQVLRIKLLLLQF